jgi:uncharacterized protein YgiB involved in biofilm formation
VAESRKNGSPLHQRSHASSLSSSIPKEAGNTTTNVLWAAGMVGLVVLGNHGRQFDVQQTRYTSREDCLEDWGTEQSCQQTAASEGQTTTYVGPRYYWDPDRGKPVVIGTDGSEHVATSSRVRPSESISGRTSVVGTFSRGGFGGIGRGFGSGRGG